MRLRSLFLFILFTFLAACNAYRQKPESEISFARQDLTQKGFVLAPIAVPDDKLNPGTSELVSFDVILTNTVKEKWKTTTILSSGEIAQTIGAEEIESWRTSLGDEDLKDASASTIEFLKKLTTNGRSYPKQILLPTILQNTVSCGQKDAVNSYLSSDPHGKRQYCQRILKMRFRIMSPESSELLWNGLIYATQENAADLEEEKVEAPSTQSLVRECFHNFTKQFQ